MYRLIALCAVTTLTMAASASAQQLLAERGAYLVNGVGACSNCHTPRGPGGATDLQRDKLLSGSTQTFQAPQYVVKGSNLTPDRATGLGAWSDDQIKIAIARSSIEKQVTNELHLFRNETGLQRACSASENRVK